MGQNKGGRPRLPEEEKKQFKVMVRLTPPQRTAFDSSFELSGYKTHTDFIIARTSSLQSAMSPAELEQITELRIAVSELVEQHKRIGNNFNQLMHLAQAEKRLPSKKELDQVAAAFESLSSYTSIQMEFLEKLKEKWLSK